MSKYDEDEMDMEFRSEVVRKGIKYLSETDDEASITNLGLYPRHEIYIEVFDVKDLIPKQVAMALAKIVGTPRVVIGPVRPMSLPAYSKPKTGYKFSVIVVR